LQATHGIKTLLDLQAYFETRYLAMARANFSCDFFFSVHMFMVAQFVALCARVFVATQSMRAQSVDSSFRVCPHG
jgi:hypothetical protein